MEKAFVTSSPALLLKENGVMPITCKFEEGIYTIPATYWQIARPGIVQTTDLLWPYW